MIGITEAADTPSAVCVLLVASLVCFCVCGEESQFMSERKGSMSQKKRPKEKKETEKKKDQR